MHSLVVVFLDDTISVFLFNLNGYGIQALDQRCRFLWLLGDDSDASADFFLL